jgi:hypothetical protein
MGFGTPVVLTTVENNQDIMKERSSYVKDFWSDIADVINLPSLADDTPFPSITVAGLPDSISITRVILILKVRAIENTSANANAVNGDQVIQVKKDSEAWSAGVTAINMVATMWAIDAATREAGDVVLGDNDIKIKVDGNGTYDIQWADALVYYDNLQLNDIQVGFRIFWEVE